MTRQEIIKAFKSIAAKTNYESKLDYNTNYNYICSKKSIKLFLDNSFLGIYEFNSYNGYIRIINNKLYNINNIIKIVYQNNKITIYEKDYKFSIPF